MNLHSGTGSKGSKGTRARERIMQSARTLFHLRGYNDVGVSEICAKAQVVKGSFYHHFASKGSLLEAVIEDNRERLLQQLRESAREPVTGRQRLLNQLQSIIDSAVFAFEEQGIVSGCNIGNLASELSVTSIPARQRLASAFRHWQMELEQSVADGIVDGSLAPTVDPVASSHCLLAVIQGMSTLGRTFHDVDMLRGIAIEAAKRLLPARAGARP